MLDVTKLVPDRMAVVLVGDAYQFTNPDPVALSVVELPLQTLRFALEVVFTGLEGRVLHGAILWIKISASPAEFKLYIPAAGSKSTESQNNPVVYTFPVASMVIPLPESVFPPPIPFAHR